MSKDVKQIYDSIFIFKDGQKTNLAITLFNVNGLNVPIKRQNGKMDYEIESTPSSIQVTYLNSQVNDRFKDKD